MNKKVARAFRTTFFISANVVPYSMTTMAKRSIAFLFLIASVAAAQHSPYFPRNGAGALAQTIRGIQHPAAYLVVALAPGFEDRAAIAKISVGNGSHVAVAFLSNGEDIPSDHNGEMFYQLASRRKEEAYQSLSILGAEAYFLNIPVSDISSAPSCFRPSPSLSQKVSDRLDSVIAQVRPDVIILEGDPVAAGSASSRLAFVQQRILGEIRNKKKNSAGSVKSFYLQTMDAADAVDIPVDQKDPVWNESYAAMADKAEIPYASLRFHLPLWRNYSPHRYAEIFPGHSKASLPLEHGLPPVSGELKALFPVIQSIGSIARMSNRDQLSALRAAIARTDAVIQRSSKSMDPVDSRVLTTWKLGLEALRCQVLGVKITYTVSDTVLTPVQVFFLTFGKLPLPATSGETQILFPGTLEKQWIVNESQKTFYDLKDSAQFRVVTPRSIGLNSTETPAGFGAFQVRAPFKFIVTHHDPDTARNFMYREEVPLVIAPYRSAEVLTPKIVFGRDTSICIRLRSNVRDKMNGSLFTNDPVVSVQKRKIEFPGKNYTETDTLLLSWNDTALTAPHEVAILAGPRNPAGTFVVEPLSVKTKNAATVAVCSVIDHSPLESAFRRLGIAAVSVDAGNLSLKWLSGVSAVVVDQFSMDKFFADGTVVDSLDQWVKRGGRLIVLPQFQGTPAGLLLAGDISFTRLSAEDCAEKLFVDTTAGVMRWPNKIESKELAQGPFPLFYNDVTGGKDGSLPLMRSGNHVLLLEQPDGRGKIFYCSLNLYPRLLTIDKASYELLANLVSTESE